MTSVVIPWELTSDEILQRWLGGRLSRGQVVLALVNRADLEDPDRLVRVTRSDSRLWSTCVALVPYLEPQPADYFTAGKEWTPELLGSIQAAVQREIDAIASGGQGEAG